MEQKLGTEGKTRTWELNNQHNITSFKCKLMRVLIVSLSYYDSESSAPVEGSHTGGPFLLRWINNRLRIFLFMFALLGESRRRETERTERQTLYLEYHIQ
ncbi:hypothetical protein AMECASPLE_026965, partial [Ameca splendens]